MSTKALSGTTNPVGQFIADPITRLSFSLYEGRGAFALLVGSGLSRAAEIPTGWEITLDLVRRVGLAQGAKDQPDWAAWYREQTGEEPNYSKLVEGLGTTPEERRAILHGYIEPTEEDRSEGRKVPTAAHRAIASLVAGGYIKVIITTNFDRLLENALRERGIEPTIVASVDALSGAEPLAHSGCYILKLHGDYKDARILNTEAELSAYPKPYGKLLDRIFDEYGLIVAGWSGEWDDALRSAILRAPNRRYPVFWATRGEPRDRAVELIRQRSAVTIPITDADAFFVSVAQKVETLEQSQRQNPLSIELLVASTKRFLTKPEYRIQLDDLVTDEAQRLLTQLEEAEFAGVGTWDVSVFRSRVKKYEAITESLATVAGVLGRWGDGAELPLVLDVIRGLYAKAETNSGGITFYLNLRSYPAVLVFTAYGLGLVRAGRWAALHQLFTAQLARENREPVRMIQALFLWAWKGTENDAWKQVEGLSDRKTPLSDHLLELFRERSKAFIGLTPDYEVLFEKFELLGSLAYLERHEKEDVRAGLVGDPRNAFTWMPVGRSGWHESVAGKVFADIMGDQKADLVAAGFGRGDPEFIDLFQQNFGRFAGRMRW